MREFRHKHNHKQTTTYIELQTHAGTSLGHVVPTHWGVQKSPDIPERKIATRRLDVPLAKILLLDDQCMLLLLCILTGKRGAEERPKTEDKEWFQARDEGGEERM